MSLTAESTNNAAPLPCPFCGRAPEQSSRASEWNESGRVFFIRCMCDGYAANAHMSGQTLEEVLTKWNTRWGRKGV